MTVQTYADLRDFAHAPPAPSVGGLEDDGQAILFAELKRLLGRLHRSGRAGNHLHSCMGRGASTGQMRVTVTGQRTKDGTDESL